MDGRKDFASNIATNAVFTSLLNHMAKSRVSASPSGERYSACSGRAIELPRSAPQAGTLSWS